MYKYYDKKYKRKSNVSWGIFVLLTAFFIFISVVSAQNQNQLFIMLTVSIAVIGFVYYFLILSPGKIWKEVLNTPFPDDWRNVLIESVEFYNELDLAEKEYFENRIQYFIKSKKITGIGTDIDIRLKLLVAASAIIPVFAFPDFEYDNINEILIYPESFDEEYNTGNKKRILGMVGDGAMNRMMILSKKDILASFDGSRTVDNVALHEFVHLIDKKDGVIDGIPAILMNRAYLLPWLKELKKELHSRNHSDINPYAFTNESEFLAVASEYFFMSPKVFKTKHPKLYRYFTKIYRRKLYL